MHKYIYINIHVYMYIYIYDRRMHQLYNAPYGTNHYGASHP